MADTESGPSSRKIQVPRRFPKKKYQYRRPKKLNHRKLIKDLANGVYVDITDENGDTLLHVAIRSGDEKSVETLLHYGANTRIKTLCPDGKKGTALHLAVLMRNHRITQLLLTSNIDFPMTSNKIWNEVLQCAVQRSNIELVKYLRSNFDFKNNLGRKVEELLQAKEEESLINLYTDGEQTPLSLSISSRSLTTFKLLLKHGANINQMIKAQPSMRIGNLIAPLHLICFESDCTFTFLNHFIKYADKYRADKNIITSNGLTALHIAVVTHNVKLLDTLLNWNLDTTIKGDYRLLNCTFTLKSLTPLHMAVALGNLDSIKSLSLRGNKNDVNTTNQFGESVLFSAIGHSDIKIINCLLANNVDVNYYMNSKGLTALHYAVYLGNIEIFNALVGYGADIKKLTGDGDSCLHLAVRSGDHTLIKRCIDLGINVDYPQTNSLNTPMHYAAFYFQPTVVRLLLKHGANVNALNVDQLSPLTYAIRTYDRQEHPKITDEIQANLVSILLNAGANICMLQVFPIEVLYVDMPLGRVMLHHVIRLFIAGIPIHEDIENHLFLERDLQFSERCNQEIELVKVTKISPHSFVTYYHYLVKDAEQLSNYAKNMQIIKFFKQKKIEKKFPIYGTLIVNSFKRSVLQCKLLKTCTAFLWDLFNNFENLPIIIISQIVSYLSAEDLSAFENYTTEDV